MAKTIEYKNMYVSVTPYEHEGQKFDTLSVSVNYKKGKGFMQAGRASSAGAAS